MDGCARGGGGDGGRDNRMVVADVGVCYVGGNDGSRGKGSGEMVVAMVVVAALMVVIEEVVWWSYIACQCLCTYI